MFPWFFPLVHTTDEDLKFRFFALQMPFHAAQNIMLIISSRVQIFSYHICHTMQHKTNPGFSFPQYHTMWHKTDPGHGTKIL